ncbi:hypothetical protein CU097_007458 [Rhizopus azygosporus]|uniref:Uncharacterized protein n=1 Tax=Rhizopus azygosporus TaxID=86630 RepID=A0A367JUT6_RHIAZ|nr:hypothetical protein CU097_007458 [Rhizopus azygosporus]
MLKLWSNWLSSRVLVGELEAMTCQWQEPTAYISPTTAHYVAVARLLQIVLSVKRFITLNHMRLMTMIEAIESDTEEEEEPEYAQEALMQLKSVRRPNDTVGVDGWKKTIIDNVSKALEQQKTEKSSIG